MYVESDFDKQLIDKCLDELAEEEINNLKKEEAEIALIDE